MILHEEPQITTSGDWKSDWGWESSLRVGLAQDVLAIEDAYAERSYILFLMREQGAKCEGGRTFEQCES